MDNTKEIRIAEELLTNFLTTGYRSNRIVECSEGLPEGAKLVNAKLDPSGNLVLYFQHESFVDSDGKYCPYIVPKYHDLARIHLVDGQIFEAVQREARRRGVNIG
jgi:hypothetical protein